MKTILAAAALAGACLASCDASASTILQGRVTARDTGAPLANVSASQLSGCATTCLFTSTDTDIDGRFTLTVEPGPVNLSFVADSSTDYVPLNDDITVADGGVAAVAYAMDLGGSVSGTVRRAADGAGLSDVYVSLYGDAQTNSVFTDSDGHFVIRQVAAGSYTANLDLSRQYNLQPQWFSGRPATPPSQGPQLADPIVVAPGQQTSAVDFNMVAGAILRSTITDRFTHLPLRNTWLTFYLYEAPNPTYEWIDESVETDDDGVALVKGLPQHALILLTQGGAGITPYGYTCGDYCSPSDGTPIQLTVGQTTDIAFALQPAAVVTGRVTAKQSGAPVADAEVVLFQHFGTSSTIAAAHTDADGVYYIENLPNFGFGGVFAKVVGAHAGATAFLNQIYGGIDCASSPCPLTGAEPFVPVVPDGVSPNVNFQLDEGGEITGSTIVDPAYAGPRDVYFELFGANGSLDSSFFSDDAGNFRSDGLAAGTYYLVSYPDASSGLPCLIYSLVSCAAGAPEVVGTPITVNGTEHVSLTVPLYTEEIFGNNFE